MFKITRTLKGASASGKQALSHYRLFPPCPIGYTRIQQPVSRPRMKIILSIGHPTPGTLHLRQRLAGAWSQLAAQHVMLPALSPASQAWTLAQAITAENETGRPAPADLAQEHALLGSNHNITQGSLKAQMQHVAPATVLLFPASSDSSEDATNAARTALAKLLHKAEVHLYCALPRPDLHLERLLTRRISDGAPLGALAAETEALLDSPHVDYRQLLAPWLTLFPKAPLHLHAAQDPDAEIARYCEIAGLPALPDLSIAPQQPRPLPRALLDPMRLANALAPGDFDFHAELQSRLGQCTLPQDADVELFGAEIRQRLHDSFAPVAEALAQHTGGGAAFEDLDAILRPRPIPLDQLHPSFLRALPGFPTTLFRPRLHALRQQLKKKRSDKSAAAC